MRYRDDAARAAKLREALERIVSEAMPAIDVLEPNDPILLGEKALIDDDLERNLPDIKSRLDQLSMVATITHVDGQRVPAERVLVWIESSLVKLGAEPSMRHDGEFTREEFDALDPHGVRGS